MNNEPVAIRYDFDGYGYQYMDSGSGSDWQTRVDGEPLYTHPVKEQKCIVKGCKNHKNEGGFVNDLCKPCHQFITTGEGVYSQAYRNSNPADLTDEEIFEFAKEQYGDAVGLYNHIGFARAMLRKEQEK